MTEEERKVKFLVGLARLTRETGIAVTGCGCCGSPDLMALEAHESDARAGYGYGSNGEVMWVSPDVDWLWDEHSHSIVSTGIDSTLAPP